MMHDPTIFSTARAEHALRVREAQRAGEDAAREGRAVPPRTPFRRRAGVALVALGHRVGGTAPSPATGQLGRVAG